MALIDMTPEHLSSLIGETVPEIFVVVAKNSVLELDVEAIASLLGSEVAEIEAIQKEDLYVKVRLLIAVEYARTLTNKELSWDSLEEQALSALGKRMKTYENDPELMLRIASIANKAQRRMNPSKSQVLDPNANGARVPLTLSRRIIEKLNNGTVVEHTEQVSVMNGSALIPSFKDIDGLLEVSRARLPQKVMTRNNMPDPDLAEIVRDVNRKGDGL